jgi:hypothetical protein
VAKAKTEGKYKGSKPSAPAKSAQIPELDRQDDPICADHEPDERSGDRATHAAACHGCLLIAETSCESRNLFLDRALLVRTMQGNNTAFFETP